MAPEAASNGFGCGKFPGMPEPTAHSSRDALRRSPLFGALDDSELDQLLSISRSQRFEDGAFLCRKGAEPDRICALVDGRARVISLSRDGREIVLRLLEAGDVCGEIAILDGRPRSADVRADGDVTAIVIERRRFQRFLLEHPSVALKLLGVMARKLRDTSTLLEESVFLGTAERVARLLVRLARSHGEERADGWRIALGLSQADLGSMAGCVRESANRRIRGWVKDGILSVEEGTITIHELDALEDIAKGIH